MQELFLYAFIISLKNTAIHVMFWEGMLFGKPRIWASNILDRTFGLKASRYIQKPLWDCLPCMASVWTVIWLIFDGYVFDGNIIQLFFVVCGISALIDSLLPNVCSHPENNIPD